MFAAIRKGRFLKHGVWTLLLYLSPLALLVAFLTGLRFHSRIAATQESNLELARLTAAAFTNYLDHLWDTEDALGNTIVETAPQGAVVDKLLAKQLNVCPSVRHFLVLDATGRVVYSSDPQARGVSFADRYFIQDLLQGKRAVVSDLLVGRLSRQPSLIVGRAIWRGTTLKALIIASVDVSKLAWELPTRKGQADVGLVDAAGNIVYESRNPRIPLNTRFLGPTSPAWRALFGETAFSERIISETDSSVRIGVAIPIETLGWAALASAPRAEALAPAYAGTLNELGVILLIVGATMAIVLLLFRDLARHSAALSTAAAAFAEGNYNVRMNVSKKGELARAETAFNRMAERIQELEHDRTRFIQLAAHELRTPMTTVKGICGILAKDLQSRPETESLAGILDKEVNHLAGLVNDILNTFLLKEGRFNLDLRPVNLVEVIQSALGSFQAAEPGRITFHADADSVTVLGDKKRLRQVFLNFVSNSVKYSGPGTPIEITLCAGVDALPGRTNNAGSNATVDTANAGSSPIIDTASAAVETDSHATDTRFVTVSVKDNGRGIPTGQLHKIFYPFFRATNVEDTSETDGIGLGLNLCKDIIERHGGQVWVESEENVGSTFYVRLKVHSENCGSAKPSAP